MICFTAGITAVLSARSNQVELTASFRFVIISPGALSFTYSTREAMRLLLYRRQGKAGENNTWVSPGASHTWSNLSFPLLTPPQAAKECKLSNVGGIKERRHTVKWSLERRWQEKHANRTKQWWIKMIQCGEEEEVGRRYNTNFEKSYHCYTLQFPPDDAVVH